MGSKGTIGRIGGDEFIAFYESEESGSKLCVDADIDAIKKIIGGCEDNKGAYLVEYEGFKNIYKFLERVVERTNDSYQIMLFTITDTTGHIPDTDIVSRAMNTMEDIISNHLRKGDVATNFSSCQYIVILTGVNTRRCDIVAARILEMFRQEFNNEDIII